MYKEEPQTRVSGEQSMPWHLHQRTLEGVIQADWLDLNKTIAFRYGLSLTEVRVTRLEDCWRVMLKAVNSRQRLVSYVYVDHFSETFEFAAFLAGSGALGWKNDDYPVKRAKWPGV